MKTKNIIIIGLVAAAAIAVIGIRAHADTVESEDLKPLSASYEIVETTDLNKLNSLIQESQKRMDDAHDMAEAARNLSYDEEHAVIQLAQDEYAQAKSAKQHYESKYAEQKKIEEGKKMFQSVQEYPAAGQIWYFLKQCGYSDIVASGIIGNFMTEAGYGLNIQYDARSKSGLYYGIAQWNIKFYPAVNNKNLNQQLYFLKDTIQKEINTYGFKYKSNYKYENFIQSQTIEEATLAFVKSYERGGQGTYQKRINNAYIAYKYFVGE